MSLVFDNPVQPILAMPPNLAIWPQHESLIEPAGRWRIYLHRLGWAALQPWFEAEFDQPVHPWPTADPLDVWALVDGLALTLGSRRILVILSETIDAATLEVPQEWVDLPGWTADYYMAAQVDIDQQRLALWGYATYDQVKTQGVYDWRDRTYSLSDADLIQDFSVFWVAQQLEQPQSIALPALPALSSAPAEPLIERLSRAVEPRLDIPFEQWGALLSHEGWRQRLWQRRQGLTPVDLGSWLRREFTPGWQALGLLRPAPMLGFRAANTSDTVISQGKPIGLTPPGGNLVLGVQVATADDVSEASPSGNYRRIRIQLFPLGEDLLPDGVTLTLDLPDTAEPVQTVQAGDRDNSIQLPSFRCPAGQRFRVRVQLGDAIVQEDFVS